MSTRSGKRFVQINTIAKLQPRHCLRIWLSKQFEQRRQLKHKGSAIYGDGTQSRLNNQSRHSLEVLYLNGLNKKLLLM